MNKLAKYKKQRVEKLVAVTTGISIERRHKVFLETNSLNLSAIVRDCLDNLIDERDTPIEAQAKIIARVFIEGRVSPDREIEKLVKLIEEQED